MTDVAIIGGGPAGSTVGTLLRKYDPALRVTILEKERFPREHVGESQLPAIGAILHEMGAWDKVEAAGFPIKLGASLTWGRNGEKWDFDFYPVERFVDEPRPGRYQGQRMRTAWQVDRAIYDTILLDHAAELGCEVRQQTRVERIEREGDRITGLALAGGERLEADWYIDATGAAGALRRAMDVGIAAPQELRNIAIYGYWDNVEWAIQIGVGGTRVQVRSLPYGWIWFIPLGPTRASVGLVCPADYYRDSGKAPAALYHESLQRQEDIAALMRDAQMTGEVQTTKDWSQVCDRLVGANWAICGEAAGFADPILAAGMTLAHTSARELAYTILEARRGEQDRDWLLQSYNDKTRRNIEQHIRFAQFWYASNGCFSDLQEHCQKIAGEAGLALSPQEAWRWLAQGGFTNQSVDSPNVGSFDLASARRLVNMFGEEPDRYSFMRHNVYELIDLSGVRRGKLPVYEDGRVKAVECLRRSGKVLPVTGAYNVLLHLLRHTSDAATLFGMIQSQVLARAEPQRRSFLGNQLLQALEVMALDGWVRLRTDPARPLPQPAVGSSLQLRPSAEGAEALRRARASRGSGATSADML
ncbi:MAG: NAD(P)/FAD-dependent oxidoreductase [Phycisphaerales bacterium JB039]